MRKTMIAVIRGTGSYIPPRVVENEELKNYIETNDTWIRERTGIEMASCCDG